MALGFRTLNQVISERSGRFRVLGLGLIEFRSWVRC